MAKFIGRIPELDDPPKSQAQRIQEIGLGAWLDEPMDLDEYYGRPPAGPTRWARIRTWFKTRLTRKK